MNAYGVSLQDSCSSDRKIWDKIWISGNQAALELNRECVHVGGWGEEFQRLLRILGNWWAKGMSGALAPPTRDPEHGVIKEATPTSSHPQRSQSLIQEARSGPRRGPHILR